MGNGSNIIPGGIIIHREGNIGDDADFDDGEKLIQHIKTEERKGETIR